MDDARRLWWTKIGLVSAGSIFAFIIPIRAIFAPFPWGPNSLWAAVCATLIVLYFLGVLVANWVLPGYAANHVEKWAGRVASMAEKGTLAQRSIAIAVISKAFANDPDRAAAAFPSRVVLAAICNDLYFLPHAFTTPGRDELGFAGAKSGLGMPGDSLWQMALSETASVDEDSWANPLQRFTSPRWRSLNWAGTILIVGLLVASGVILFSLPEGADRTIRNSVLLAPLIAAVIWLEWMARSYLDPLEAWESNLFKHSTFTGEHALARGMGAAPLAHLQRLPWEAWETLLASKSLHRAGLLGLVRLGDPEKLAAARAHLHPENDAVFLKALDARTPA